MLCQVTIFLGELSGLIQVAHGIGNRGEGGHSLLTTAVGHVQKTLQALHHRVHCSGRQLTCKMTEKKDEAKTVNNSIIIICNISNFNRALHKKYLYQ